MKKYLFYSVAFLVFAIFFIVSAVEHANNTTASMLFSVLALCSVVASLLGYFCYLDEHDK